jgi:leucyl/phenylalanyl-tRNA--protein transferase
LRPGAARCTSGATFFAISPRMLMSQFCPSPPTPNRDSRTRDSRTREPRLVPGEHNGAMPVEPPRSAWLFPDLFDPMEEQDLPTDLIGKGADLDPGTLLAAYRGGLFPMAELDVPPGRTESLSWWSPRRRGVLPLRNLRVTRSLAKSCRSLEVRVDTAFEEVVHACATPERDGGWISPEVEEAYLTLHQLGWAHSFETWRDGELVGGLYGVAIGGLFAGESMFHRVRDASKVALVGLVEMLSDEHADHRLLDVQWETPHLASLGVVSLPRRTYLHLLGRALHVPLPEPWR